MPSASLRPRLFSGRSKSAKLAAFHSAFPCRMRVSRNTSAACANHGHLLRRLHEQPAVLDLDVEGADRLVRRRCERIPGAQAEARAVAGADDLAGVDLGAGEAFSVVAAAVFDREELAAAGDDDDGVAIHLRGEGARFGN